MGLLGLSDEVERQQGGRELKKTKATEEGPRECSVVGNWSSWVVVFGRRELAPSWSNRWWVSGGRVAIGSSYQVVIAVSRSEAARSVGEVLAVEGGSIGGDEGEYRREKKKERRGKERMSK